MTDKTDSKDLQDFASLVDAYAEAYHVCGDHTYSEKTAAAREALLRAINSKGFDAADMATASANGFRDGVASDSVNSDGSITPGTWAHLKLMMEESAWGGEIQLSDALANVDEFARASLAASAGSEPMFWVRLCSDGLYEGPIHNARIEKVRKLSGAWSPLYLHPSPPEGMMGGWLNPEDMAALQRVDECFDDGEGHDLPKARVDRLIELGVMRHNGRGYYSITSFGSFVLGCEHRHLPLETSSECNERLGREHKERRLMDKSAPPTSSADSRKGE